MMLDQISEGTWAVVNKPMGLHTSIPWFSSVQRRQGISMVTDQASDCFSAASEVFFLSSSFRKGIAEHRPLNTSFAKRTKKTDKPTPQQNQGAHGTRGVPNTLGSKVSIEPRGPDAPDTPRGLEQSKNPNTVQMSPLFHSALASSVVFSPSNTWSNI